MRRFALLLSSILLIPALAAASPKIFHGAVVNSDTQFPFVVAIYDREGARADCTGSVIGDRWILTAEHCVINYASGDDDENENTKPKLHEPEDLQVGTGYLAANKSAANKVFSVKKIYVPNNTIDLTLTRDVAVLELNESIGIAPVTLPQPTQVFPELKSGTQKATAIGYGFSDLKFSPECAQNPDDEKCELTDVTYDNDLHFGNELLQTDADAINILDKIRTLLPPENDDIIMQYNPVTMLASTSPAGNYITNGDSGGPLMIGSVQIGVVSWGAPTPGSYKAFNLGGKHLHIDYYALLSDPVTLDFIQSTMKKKL